MPEITFIIVVAMYSIGLWMTWKFYRALASIGEEIAELKELLRQRLPRPERPPAG
jgi:hypothetical protein